MTISHISMSQNIDKIPETTATGKMEVGFSSGYFTNFNEYWGFSELAIHGWGWNLIARYPLKSILSGKINLFYGYVDRVSISPWEATDNTSQFQKIGLVEEVFDIYRPENGHPDGFWFPNYRNKSKSMNADLIFSISNLISKIDKKEFSWEIYGSIGFGLLNKNYSLNLYDDNGDLYSDLIRKVQFDFNTFNSSEGRKKLRKDIPKFFDNSYETDSEIRPINLFSYSFNGGISKSIGDRFLIGFEFRKLFYPKSEKLKSLPFRTFTQLATDDIKGEFYSLNFSYRLF